MFQDFAQEAAAAGVLQVPGRGKKSLHSNSLRDCYGCFEGLGARSDRCSFASIPQNREPARYNQRPPQEPRHEILRLSYGFFGALETTYISPPPLPPPPTMTSSSSKVTLIRVPNTARQACLRWLAYSRAKISHQVSVYQDCAGGLSWQRRIR